jgi:non-catalytic primase subunit PriX-like protein
MKIDDIDFIMSHFGHQSELFPRKMMTYDSKGQFVVETKQVMYERCQKSGFVDCRINGYPVYTEWKGVIRHPPNFLFFDLDLCNCSYDPKRLDCILKKTLKEIGKFSGSPTVLWTGNGYHIYQPIEAFILDQESIFSKDNFPNLFSGTGKYSNWSVSEVFLKYAEIFFTKGRADSLHKPKYKTCLIRIPGSYNSKLIHKGLEKEESLVKIIQRWDGIKFPIQNLLKEFRRWITTEEYGQKLKNSKKDHFKQISFPSPNRIEWIERLLRTPLNDNRKYCLLHVLAPYLVNVKNLPTEESAKILEIWLLHCSKLRPLDFNPYIEIKSRLKYVKDYRPMGLSKLRTDNKELCRLLSL